MAQAPLSADTAFARHGLFAEQVREGLEYRFPFETVLSLAPVVAHWQAMAEKEPETYAAASRTSCAAACSGRSATLPLTTDPAPNPPDP